MVWQVVAHAGPGSTWQALLTALALGLAVTVVLAVLGRLEVGSFDDLILPLAATAIVSSLAPLASEWLSDWIGWSLPLLVVVVIGLLLAVTTSLELTPSSPLTLGMLAVFVVAAVTLHQPLRLALHPLPEELPLATDAEVEIVVPEEGATIEAGTVEVAVVVRGGSIGPGDVPVEQLPEDPEEAGGLTVYLDQDLVEPDYLEDCTLDAPCTSVTFPVEVEVGARQLWVEFTRGDGTPLAPFVADAVGFEVR